MRWWHGGLSRLKSNTRRLLRPNELETGGRRKPYSQNITKLSEERKGNPEKCYVRASSRLLKVPDSRKTFLKIVEVELVPFIHWVWIGDREHILRDQGPLKQNRNKPNLISSLSRASWKEWRVSPSQILREGWYLSTLTIPGHKPVILQAARFAESQVGTSRCTASLGKN